MERTQRKLARRAAGATLTVAGAKTMTEVAGICGGVGVKAT